MGNIGFDNEQYLRTQSEKIRERVQLFGGKLYMEFGGKLFDDYHASRVLPGFLPDSKVKMLLQMKDQAEIVIVISAGDIEKEQGPRGLGHHLRRGRAAADRRLPGHWPVCGQRGADPVQTPSPRRRPSKSVWSPWG